MNKKKYLFIFKWETGSINDNIIKGLKEKNISFYYNHFFKLMACIDGREYNINHEQINDDFYGVMLEET